MSLRARSITSYRTDDEASNRFQEHLKEVLNPVLRELASPQMWQSPTFQNGWVNFGPGQATVAYMKDALGFVHLRGTAKNGTVGTTLFNLPSGYRPVDGMPFTVNSGSALGIVSVTANGDVVQNVGVNSSLSLNGVTFDTRP